MNATPARREDEEEFHALRCVSMPRAVFSSPMSAAKLNSRKTRQTDSKRSRTTALKLLAFFVFMVLAWSFAPGAWAQRAGDLDTSFLNNMAGPDNGVHWIALQEDGKILITGFFQHVNGEARAYLARLNTDGSLDHSFLNGLAGPDLYVIAATTQKDGNVLVAGMFTSFNSVARSYLARLHPDGSLDTAFLNGLPGPDARVFSVTVQPDGKILIGGSFSNVNATVRSRLARLNPDGSLDTSFLDGMAGVRAPDYEFPGPVDAIFVQSDRKVLIGGCFTNINGMTRTGLARLNPDGSLDATFVGGSDWTMMGGIDDVLGQEDGKVLVAGLFRTSNIHMLAQSLVRLNFDGSPDTTFLKGSVSPVSPLCSLALQSDGKVLIGGGYYSVNGMATTNLARLNPDGTLDTLFTNQIDWTVHPLVLQPDGKILIGGVFTHVNGVERKHLARLWSEAADPAPCINSQPKSLTVPNTPEAEATFAAWVNGAKPFGYQWLFNGTLLTNGTRISGATSNVLTVAPVQLADAGVYTLLVTNAFGRVSSAPATLVVDVLRWGVPRRASGGRCVARLAAPWDRSQIKPWSRVVWRRIIPWIEAS